MFLVFQMLICIQLNQINNIGPILNDDPHNCGKVLYLDVLLTCDH